MIRHSLSRLNCVDGHAWIPVFDEGKDVDTVDCQALAIFLREGPYAKTYDFQTPCE